MKLGMLDNWNSTVKSLIAKFVIWRHLSGIAVQKKMTELLREMLYLEPLFTYCSSDMFDPILVREGRKEMERYRCFFVSFKNSHSYRI